WGFGWDELHARNPKLVYASISGYGQTGPEAWEGAYDVVIQAESGLMSVTGFPDGPPVLTGTSIADYLAGLNAFG
ncbi:MAG: CoA transferase, partial [Acidimicrobiales bacterium]|nr:CoA transferase [Acidimicrobiales bacterium]